MNIMQHRMTGRIRMSGVAVGLLVAVLAACAGAVKDHAGNTSVYIVRHAEVNRDDPDRPLIEKGRARAQALVQHLQGVSITHLLTSHTDRTRDTLVPLAKARGLEIKQFPSRLEARRSWPATAATYTESWRDWA
jgi:broad specificity phosphatase PhoE